MTNKTQNITTFKPEEFVSESSKVLKALIESLLEESVTINIALSGGSSPLPVYKNIKCF